MNLYEKMLAASKAVIADIERPFKMREEKSNLNLIIVKLESEVASNQRKVQELKFGFPVDWDKLMSAIDTQELSERKLLKYNALQEE